MRKPRPPRRQSLAAFKEEPPAPQARTAGGIHFVPVVRDGEAASRMEPDLPWTEATIVRTATTWGRIETWDSYPAPAAG
jgi:hypothetical protein